VVGEAVRLLNETWLSKSYRRRNAGLSFRHCEKRSDEAIQSGTRDTGLPRFARNDEVGCVVMEWGLLFEVGHQK
jgi:hypothetical protein